MSKTVRFLQTGMPALACFAFILWLREQEEPLSMGTPFAALSLGLYVLILTAVLVRLAKAKPETNAAAAPRDTGRERLRAWGVLLLFGIAVSLLEYGLVYLVCRPEEGFWGSFEQLYYRGDVAHYMGIARDGYVQAGAERLRLVFLPLYPLTIRALTFAGDYFRGAFLASQLFSLVCLPAAYELFRLDMDRWDAMASARLLFLLPGGAFLRIPMSEGLFLFLTLMAVYMARRRRFLWACLFTALSALTRSLGILLLGLVGLEMWSALAKAYKQNRRAALRLVPRYLCYLLLGCCGTLVYLIINRMVGGGFFTFLTYQKENWNQRMGLFFNTAAYLVKYIQLYLEEGDWASVLSLSLPNLVCLFGVLWLLFVDRDRMRISYALWSLVYFAAAIGATWLLSGPRYLAMLFPLAPILRQRSRTPGQGYALEALLWLSQALYLLMLALDMSVY